MKHEQHTNNVTREHIMKLLSDDEIGRVSTAETAAKLSNGDEYIDLAQLTKGVQRAASSAIDMDGVLPKKSVAEPTWRKIVTQLQAQPATPARL